MYKIGLTGGIGSGKSTVSSLFSMMLVPVYIADVQSKRLLKENEEIKKALISLFGKEVYQKENVDIDKKRLAELIFSNQANLKKVNAIIHPAVFDDFFQWCSRQDSKIVAVESAILFESGLDKKVDMVVNVSAPIDCRIQRVMNRDGLSEEEIRNRIQNQMSDEQRNLLSQYIIINDNLHPLIPQVVSLLSSI